VGGRCRQAGRTGAGTGGRAGGLSGPGAALVNRVAADARLTFGFRMDGLAWVFALLICAIGALVVLYAAYYLHAKDPAARFFRYLLLFMGAMLGLVLADNLCCWSCSGKPRASPRFADRLLESSR